MWAICGCWYHILLCNVESKGMFDIVAINFMNYSSVFWLLCVLCHNKSKTCELHILCKVCMCMLVLHQSNVMNYYVYIYTESHIMNSQLSTVFTHNVRRPLHNGTMVIEISKYVATSNRQYSFIIIIIMQVHVHKASKMSKNILEWGNNVWSILMIWTYVGM